MSQPKTTEFTSLSAGGRVEVSARANPRGEAELLVFGDIGGWGGGISVSAKDVVAELAGMDAQLIRVRINSGGGSVADGLAIYNALKRHPASITVTIEGIAASIASLIAMAGDRVEMESSSLMMIHAPWYGTTGNARDLENSAAVLRRHEEAIAGPYATKSGQSNAAILELLRKYEDQWFTASEAVAAGFADAIVDSGIGTNAGMQLVRQPSFQRITSRMPAQIAAAFNLPATKVLPDHNGDIAMPQGNQAEVTAAQRKEIVAAERDRVDQIRSRAQTCPGDQEVQAVADHYISAGLSPEACGQKILEILGSRGQPLGGGWGMNTMHPSGGLKSGQEFVAAASDVLAMRAGVKIDKPAPGARDIVSMSIGAIAEACLSRDDRARGLSSASAIQAAMSTSDFPAILENSIRKSMRRGYEEEPATHQAWIRRSTVPDFKPQSRVILGSMPELLPVAEGGEYTFGAMDEDKSVPFKVDKYGRVIGITWEMLVNDDLAALGRIPQGLGQSARRKEADLVYALFAGAGQVMQDAVALFDAVHANLAPTSTSLDDAALAKGRLLLRKQKALGGGELNLQPRVLLVPAELESQAEKIIAASSVHATTSTNSGLEVVTPAWIKGLQLVVESRLPDGAAYLLANPAQIDTAELAYLSGDNREGGDDVGGPMVEEEMEFVRDVRRYKVRSVMGARFLDWRGIVRLPIGG